MRLNLAKLTNHKRAVSLLIVANAVAFSFLSYYHSLVPMWIEGMAEFEHSLQIMFGFKPQVVGCWLRVGNFSVPLALGPYIGPATIYMYAPAAYLWFKGITSDPYVYRYAGIVFFLINSWLLYYLLRTYYKPSISFYGT